MKINYLFLTIVIAICCLRWWGGSYLSPAVAAERTCSIKVNVFDIVVYKVLDAEGILINNGSLIAAGDLATAINKKLLPFETKTGSETSITNVIKLLKIGLCGSVDKCNSKALALEASCSEAVIPPEDIIATAKTALVTRLGNMNSCQRAVFIEIQANNASYLKEVKQANSSYYQKLAPETVAFRRNYRKAGTKAAQQVVLNAYINSNQAMRQNFYQGQATVFSNFLSTKSQLDADFSTCSSK